MYPQPHLLHPTWLAALTERKWIRSKLKAKLMVLVKKNTRTLYPFGGKKNLFGSYQWVVVKSRDNGATARTWWPILDSKPCTLDGPLQVERLGGCFWRESSSQWALNVLPTREREHMASRVYYSMCRCYTMRLNPMLCVHACVCVPLGEKIHPSLDAFRFHWQSVY